MSDDVPSSQFLMFTRVPTSIPWNSGFTIQMTYDLGSLNVSSLMAGVAIIHEDSGSVDSVVTLPMTGRSGNLTVNIAGLTRPPVLGESYRLVCHLFTSNGASGDGVVVPNSNIVMHLAVGMPISTLSPNLIYIQDDESKNNLTLGLRTHSWIVIGSTAFLVLIAILIICRLRRRSISRTWAQTDKMQTILSSQQPSSDGTKPRYRHAQVGLPPDAFRDDGVYEHVQKKRPRASLPVDVRLAFNEVEQLAFGTSSSTDNDRYIEPPKDQEPLYAEPVAVVSGTAVVNGIGQEYDDTMMPTNKLTIKIDDSPSPRRLTKRNKDDTFDCQDSRSIIVKSPMFRKQSEDPYMQPIALLKPESF